MALLRRRDLVCGFLFILLAVLYGVRASGYRMGTASQMGPGFFPLILAGVLFVLGIAVVLSGLLRSGQLDLSRAELRSAAAVLGSVILFALMIQPAGLLIAAVLTGITCQLGSPGFRIWRAVLSAAILSLVTTAFFAWALQLPLPVLPTGL